MIRSRKRKLLALETHEILEALYACEEYAVVDLALDILTDPRGLLAHGFVDEDEIQRYLVSILDTAAATYRARNVFLAFREVDVVPLVDLTPREDRETDKETLARRVERQFPGSDLPKYVHRRRGLRPLKFLG